MPFTINNYPETIDAGQSYYNEIFMNAMATMGDPKWNMIFNVSNTDMLTGYEVAMKDVGLFNPRTTSTIEEKTIDEDYTIPWSQTEYAASFKVQEKQWKAMPAKLKAAYPLQFASSLAWTIEDFAMGLFASDAFSVVGPDGVVLCSNSHPVTGDTYDNLATASVSESEIAAGVAAGRQYLTPAGKVVGGVSFKYLLHGPSNTAAVHAALGERLSGSSTAFNDYNYAGTQGIVPIEIPSITDSRWFLVAGPEYAGAPELQFQMAPEFRSGVHEEETYRWGIALVNMAKFYRDPRFCYGSTA